MCLLLLLHTSSCAGMSQRGQEGSISLQPPGTAYLSAGDEAAVPAPAAGEEPEEGEPEADIFSSPLVNSLRREGGASSSPAPHLQAQQVQQQTPASGSRQGSLSFGFVTAAGGGEAADDDAASSGSGESEATVSEAAVVARTLTRASALQKDREQLRQQVRDLSQELRELKGKQRAMAQSMREAAAEGGGAVGGAGVGAPRAQRAMHVPQRPARAASVGGDAALEERCRLQAVEERHLRSEVETLNRKVGCSLWAQGRGTAWPPLVIFTLCFFHGKQQMTCDRSTPASNGALKQAAPSVGAQPSLPPSSCPALQCEKLNQVLLKANHAMKVLHYKLQKERKSVAGLQEEKCGLQAQLLAGGAAAPQQQQQLAALLQELSAGRARIESLLEEKGTLAARLEALASGGDRSGRSATPEQRREAAATLAALQQQQEAVAAALREELAAEKARGSVLAEQRAALEGRLQEALSRLGAAEQISGHLEQVGSSWQGGVCRFVPAGFTVAFCGACPRPYPSCPLVLFRLPASWFRFLPCLLFADEHIPAGGAAALPAAGLAAGARAAGLRVAGCRGGAPGGAGSAGDRGAPGGA